MDDFFKFFFGLKCKSATERGQSYLVHQVLVGIADSSKSGVAVFNQRGKCIYINPFLESLFLCDARSFPLVDVVYDFIRKKNSQSHKNSEKKESLLEDIDYFRNNRRYILRFSEANLYKNQKCIGFYIQVEDITNKVDEEYVQNKLRTYDPLTEIYNKSYFFEKIERRLKFDRFTEYYLLVSDVINFKLVNDLHGKAFADMILVKIAQELKEYTREDDIYGRLYNDHFAVLMPKRRFDEEDFLSSFSKTFSYLNNFSYSLVWHVGIYEIEDHSLPVSVMCDRAFMALNSIKNDYKNSVAYYDETLRDEVIQMQTLMNELPQALCNDELLMYLQPQFTKDGKTSGAEALIRWHHPQKGIIPPSDFIRIIEKINMISDVDRYMWECACQKLSEWKLKGRDNLYISVNISPKDFYTLDLYDVFTHLIKKYDISPKNLNLEITETAIIYDLDHQMTVIDRLREAGFSIEIDDFGSGYSSLNMLKDISVDVLKIDMAFLQKSNDDFKSRKILESIVHLAKELGMTVVTEGVENSSQVDFLSSFGCDLFQGFYFSRPITVSEFEAKYF